MMGMGLGAIGWDCVVGMEGCIDGLMGERMEGGIAGGIAGMGGCAYE